MALFSDRRTKQVNKWLHLALAGWLVASAFALPHTEASQGNSWMVGLLMAVVALVSIAGVHRILVLNSIFAAWLFASTWIVAYAGAGPRFHNAIVALIVFVLGLFPLAQPEQAEEVPSRQAAA